MIATVSRVKWARVEVEGSVVGEIGVGLLVFVGIEKSDGPGQVVWLGRKLAGLRIFPDENGKLNRSVVEAGGGLLLVPNFTLAADTGRGMRPSFSNAAEPALAIGLLEHLAAVCREQVPVSQGRFGTDMQVLSCGDGPINLVIKAL